MESNPFFYWLYFKLKWLNSSVFKLRFSIARFWKTFNKIHQICIHSFQVDSEKNIEKKKEFGYQILLSFLACSQIRIPKVCILFYKQIGGWLMVCGKWNVLLLNKNSNGVVISKLYGSKNKIKINFFFF
jgi:hypothetical protein